ncbi:hypothetical protein HZS_3980 [Henneguya salminicola]|nr:hypothetical protein HZS_3980 [Henneguya salminicola]
MILRKLKSILNIIFRKIELIFLLEITGNINYELVLIRITAKMVFKTMIIFTFFRMYNTKCDLVCKNPSNFLIDNYSWIMFSCKCEKDSSIVSDVVWNKITFDSFIKSKQSDGYQINTRTKVIDDKTVEETYELRFRLSIKKIGQYQLEVTLFCKFYDLSKH